MRLATTLVACLAGGQVAAGPPFYLLDPAAFAPLLGADAPWAAAAIPFFEAADANLTAAYFFRARVLLRHIAPTGVAALPFVITEFAPNVSWAGRANAIPCAAGHHLAEARWLRGAAAAVADAYSRWWVSGLEGIKLNYYFWYATALLRRLQVAGAAANLALVAEVVPNATAVLTRFMLGTLPGGGGSAFDAANDCVWNAPGNEGQERSLSGSGCRPLVQSLLYGEAASLAALCEAAGNATCAAEFSAHAARFQARLLRQWNPAISAFDTLQGPAPAPPPPPMPPNYAPFNTGQFCCDQSPCVGGHSTFLFQGPLPPANCTATCDAWPGGVCHYVTLALGGDVWCQGAQFCNATNPFADGAAATFVRTGTAGGGSGGGGGASAAAPPFAGVRELASLSSPWLFGAVPRNNASAYAASWDTAFDALGLGGAYGLRTAEARAAGYTCYKGGCCDWSGPVWPFETSKALTAAAAILQDNALAPQVPALTRARVWGLLGQYTAQHSGTWWISDGADTRANYSSIEAAGLFLGGGLGEAWVAEAGCAEDAQWTDSWREGYWYLHSSYMDVVLSAVAGLVPRAAEAQPLLRVQPLQPSDAALAYWAVDGAVVAGRVVTVFWDIDGSRYGRGAGLTVLLDGQQAAHASTTQGQALLVPLAPPV